MAILDGVKWRELILRHVWEEHELSSDVLHEGADDDADLAEAEGALAQLVAEGVLVQTDGWIATCAVGQESWLSTLVLATSPRPPHPGRA